MQWVTLNNIIQIHRAQGNLPKTLEYLQRLLTVCRKLDCQTERAVTAWNIGSIYKSLANLTKAEEYISQAVQIAEQTGHPSLEKWCDGLKQVRAKRQGTEE